MCMKIYFFNKLTLKMSLLLTSYLNIFVDKYTITRFIYLATYLLFILLIYNIF